MRKILTIVMILTLVSGTAIAREQAYFVSIPDLPLMPGITELDELTLTFDKPQGRIIESVVDIHSVSPDAIRDYYSDSLPQFGWKQLRGDTYVREDEILELHFNQSSEQSLMRVMVSPEG